MSKLGEFVVKYRKAIIIVYLVILIPSILGYIFTPSNYDLLSYMPDELNSKQGEQILEEKFELSGLGLLMARGKRSWEINRLIESLEIIEGVDNVVWLGDYADIYIPVEFIEADIKERFISGDNVLLQIQFTENARSEKTNSAVDQINELIAGDDNYWFGGEPAIINEFQAITERELLYYIALALVIIFLILTISVSSYLDPLLFMISVGVAVLINMGTNIFLGEISFLTASIAAVMQLGISLDYSIFLMHRFEEEKEKHPTIEKAMASTVGKTTTAIASSALTTVGGFAALMIMQNGIGQDMGIVLAKGIAISLIVNLTFLPGLLLSLHKTSNRFKHKILLPSFESISRWVVKGRWLILALFALLLVPSFLAQSRIDYYYSNENYLPETAVSVLATNAIMDEYGAVDVIYVITKDKGRVKEHNLVQEIRALAEVDSVVAISEQVDLALPESIIPGEVFSQFKGGDYRYFLAFTNTFGDEQQAFTTVDTIRETAGGHTEEYYVTGTSALTRDMASLVDDDARNVLIFSIICIFLIIAISFKSLFLPGILILTIQLAIWINLGVLYFQEQTVSGLTPMIIGAIQLGATVDYAILFTLRYKENIYLFSSRIDAVKQTVKDAGRSILTSALTLFSATISISLIASIRTTGEMTMLIGRGAVISMLVIFFLLPSLLLLFENVIRRTTKDWAAKPPAQATEVRKNFLRR